MMIRDFGADLESCRILDGPMGSTSAVGRNGAFRLPGGLFAVVSDGSGWTESGLHGHPWEHVSVSVDVQGAQDPGGNPRCPTWDEMCQAKRTFFGPDEAVVQFHPPASEYVNEHEHCLHLWKPVGRTIPLPPIPCV